MNEKITHYQKVLASNQSDKITNAYQELKEDIFSLAKPIWHGKKGIKILEEIWPLIRAGLLNEKGDIRVNAFYTFKTFRVALAFSEDEFNRNLLNELYELALKEKNKKIKLNLVRCLMEMKCPGLQGLAKELNFSDRYSEITEYAAKEAKGKYEKPQFFIKNDLVEYIWNNNDSIAEKLARANYDSVLENFKVFISKEDSKENFGFNTYLEGIKNGLDIIMLLLDEKTKEKVKEKIETMIEKRCEESLWEEGGFAETLSPMDTKERIRTFHMSHDEEMNHNCRKCNKKISAHNKDWHNGLCDECFDKEYY